MAKLDAFLVTDLREAKRPQRKLFEPGGRVLAPAAKQAPPAVEKRPSASLPLSLVAQRTISVRLAPRDFERLASGTFLNSLIKSHSGHRAHPAKGRDYCGYFLTGEQLQFASKTVYAQKESFSSFSRQ